MRRFAVQRTLWECGIDSPGLGADLDFPLKPLAEVIGRDVQVVIGLQPEPELR